MKKRVASRFFISIVFLMLVVFSSCSDNDESSNGDLVIRFKANGTTVRYTNQPTLLFTAASSGNQYLAIISGFNDASSNLSLTLYSDSPIDKDTYSGYSVVDIVKGVVIGYLDPKTGATFTSGGANVNATVTISDMNATTVRGTFQGVLKNNQHADITITDGEFIVKRNN